MVEAIERFVRRLRRSIWTECVKTRRLLTAHKAADPSSVRRSAHFRAVAERDRWI